MCLADTPGAVAKRLYPHLTEAGYSHRTLAQIGWFVWVANQRPNTDSAVAMACHAFTFIVLDSNYPHMIMSCVQAIIAYLSVEYPDTDYPLESELRRLKGLLERDPPDENEIHEWFHHNYP